MDQWNDPALRAQNNFKYDIESIELSQSFVDGLYLSHWKEMSTSQIVMIEGKNALDEFL